MSTDETTAVQPTVLGSESAVLAALRERYKAPEYAFLPGVNQGTGASSGRRADALAFSCWPSRGLHLIGFEVKVSRADWLREKADPAKAEAICRFCDHWFIVTGKPDIVVKSELPPTWGLIEPAGISKVGGKLIIIKDAPKLEPIPITRPFLAAIFRAAAENVGDRRNVQAEVDAARRGGFEAGNQHALKTSPWLLKNTQDQLDALNKQVREFEDASGIKLNQWSHGKQIGEAVKVIASGGLPRMLEDVGRIKQWAERLTGKADELMEVVGNSGTKP